jgi:phosphate starvation-inducible protein PhoH
MSSKPHTDQVYKEKRRIKGPIKFNVELTEEQKMVKASAYEKDVTIILGSWGTGKTATACQIALDMLFKHHNDIDKIYISRPIDFGATGYLKGSISEKLSLHVMPIIQNMYACYNKVKIDDLFAENVIQIIPIDYMKGMNQSHSVTIIDEFEDITYTDFKVILTRLCKNSKLMFTGSEEQIGISNSCLPKIKKLQNSNLVGYHTLINNHRNEDINKILDYIEAN